MNYRELLKKYISHIGACEGVTYLSDIGYDFSLKRFSPDELKMMRYLEAEVRLEERYIIAQATAAGATAYWAFLPLKPSPAMPTKALERHWADGWREAHAKHMSEGDGCVAKKRCEEGCGHEL
jgi:hypothetical protein